MTDYTIEEQIVCSFARYFKQNDDFVIAAQTPTSLIGVALAKELYAPRLSMLMILDKAPGRYAIISRMRFPFIVGNPPQDTIETCMTTEDIFDLVVKGKYFIIMQPVQLDQHGYVNLSLVGDKNAPSAVFVGSRGLPDNSVNMPRLLYYIPAHSKRVFVEKVDVSLM